jgi:hypothetical protein
MEVVAEKPGKRLRTFDAEMKVVGPKDRVMLKESKDCSWTVGLSEYTGAQNKVGG